MVFKAWIYSITTMKDRIKQIMDGQHMTQQEFSDFINIAPATLSSILRGRTRPTLAIVDAIANRFPDISTDWLLFGKEPMMRNSEAQASGTEEVSGVSNTEPTLSFAGSPDVPGRPISGALGFDAADVLTRQRLSAQREQLNIVKNIDKTQRKITEIRIFYDDQTWETFIPKK